MRDWEPGFWVLLPIASWCDVGQKVSPFCNSVYRSVNQGQWKWGDQRTSGNIVGAPHVCGEGDRGKSGTQRGRSSCCRAQDWAEKQAGERGGAGMGLGVVRNPCELPSYPGASCVSPHPHYCPQPQLLRYRQSLCLPPLPPFTGSSPPPTVPSSQKHWRG